MAAGLSAARGEEKEVVICFEEKDREVIEKKGLRLLNLSGRFTMSKKTLMKSGKSLKYGMMKYQRHLISLLRDSKKQ